MNEGELGNVMEVLNLMVESEIALSELYHACATKWPEDKEFFGKMSASELKHSSYLRQIISTVNTNPDEFKPGKAITKEQVNIMIEGIKFYSAKLKNDEMTKLEFLKTAVQIEDSIIERKYSEILRTRNPNYTMLIERIMLDTISHKSLLDERLKAKIE